VLAVEQQLLCPGENVVSEQRELKPCGVGLEVVERQMPGAGCLQRLDAVLDFGVLTVKRLKGGDLPIALVGDEALEAVPSAS